jgi:hypothetical protein
MAAPIKSQPGAGAKTQYGYEVGRPLGRCCVTGKVIEPGEKFVAALLENPTGFQRIDCSAGSWPNFDRKDVIAFWHTAMPRPEQKKKVFVDDNVLCELFERLADVSEPAKLNFRFVLGLILMRKRLVIYENTRKEGNQEIWSVRMKGRQDLLDLLNPRLDENQIREVSQQLSEILEQEL